MLKDDKGRFIQLYTTEERKSRAKEATQKWQQTESGRSAGRNAQLRYREKRRQWLFEYKKTLCCVYCGNNNPLTLDLDHIDPTTKVKPVSMMITGGYKWDDVMAEVDKCQPVCRNCHNIKSIIEAGKLSTVGDILQYIPEGLRELI